MQRRSTLLLAALTAALLLAACVTSASANRLSFSERTFRITWAPMTFIYELAEGRRANCNLTLEGSFHNSTFAKVPNSLIGYVTRAAIAPCLVTVLRETLPWHVLYGSFSGTLPTISSIHIRIVGISMRVNEFGCLARATAVRPMEFNPALVGGVFTSVPAESRIGLLMSGFCEEENFRYASTGRSALTRLGTTTALSLRLI